MQPGDLCQVNEATNVFFMILLDCFITENAINLSSSDTTLYKPANRRYTFGSKKMSANQNADTINFH